MNIPLVNVVMLIGAAQGALIGLIIVQKHTALYANRFLALMMFAISILLVHMVMDDLGLYGSLRLLFPVLLALSLAVTPLHFLYAKFLTNRQLHFQPGDAIHFVPYVIFLLVCFSFLNGPSDGRDVFLGQHADERYPTFFLVFNWVLVIQGLTYVVIVLHRIRSYENGIKNVYSSIENRQLRWLRNITLLAAVAWCAFSVEQTFLTFGINLSNFMISSVLISLYLFTLGYLGMLKAEVLVASLSEGDVVLTQAVPVSAAADGSKYEKSGLTAEIAGQYKEKILRVMETDKLYRQSDLTLSQLAEAIQATPHNLSEVINTQLGRSFYDLINDYRLRDVKNALADPSKKNLKILAIAFDAGFNSKASFNTVFKQFTHTTPSEFRRKSLAAGDP